MFKVVYLYKRHPGLRVAGFHEHLRAVHGPSACGQPEVRRYVQSLTLLKGYTKGELFFDGMDEAWFDSAEDFRTFEARGAASRPSSDASVFDPARTVVMPVDVHVMKDGAPKPGSVKSIEFVNRRADLPLDEFRRYWREHHGPLAAQIEEIRRYEQNHLRREEYNMPKPPVLDGLAITWFDGTPNMRRTVETPVYRATREDEAKFLRPGHLPFIITQETELKG
jgi:uncharacterized protein (TIGR02118 family)